MRKIEAIAYDLAHSLWSFVVNYPGSPYKEKAEGILIEYKGWTNREDKWAALKEDRSWGKLHTEIHCLLNDDDKSAGEIADKAEELLRLFRYFHQSNANEKLTQAISYLETLKTHETLQNSNNS